MTQSEVVPKDDEGNLNPLFPSDGHCGFNHTVPLGVRFFQISGPVVAKRQQGSVICELCLTVANKHSRLKKEGRAAGFDFEAELQQLVQEAERKLNGKRRSRPS